MNSGNFTTFFIGHGDNIGDVVFTLNVVIGELSQPAFKVRAIGDQNPGINFLNPALLVAGVFMLDNARHRAVIARNAAVAGRIVKLHRQQTDAALRFRFPQTLQCFDGNERHVAVQHQDIFIIAEERRRLLHGVPGA